MDILFLKILMWLQIGLSKLIDVIFELFNVFAGIENVNVEGTGDKGIDLLTYFVTNQTVITVFWTILVIGVFCSMLFTMIAVVKNAVIVKKNMMQIVMKMLISVFSMVLVVMLLFLGIFGANCILREVDNSFKIGDDDLTVGQQIFFASVTDDAWYGLEWDKKKDDDGNIIYDENGEPVLKPINNQANALSIEASKKAILENWDTITPDDVFGVKTKTLGLFEDGGKGYTKPPYIDITKYNFFIGVIASIILFITAFTTAMGLIVRLYDIVFMMLTMPLVVATVPLDDGAKFKLWRETTISKVILAYGTIFAYNIFLIFLPMLSKISLFGESVLANSLFQVLLIICGAVTISHGQLLFARIMGTSAEENREATHGFRTMFAGAMGTMGAVRGAGRMVFGTYNSFTGSREKGLLQGVKKISGGVANVGTKIMSGGFKDGSGANIKATQLMKTKISNGVGYVSDKWYNAGGVIGGISNIGTKIKNSISNNIDKHNHINNISNNSVFTKMKQGGNDND